VANPADLRPISAPKTFLNVNYNEDDEYDLDYHPEQTLDESESVRLLHDYS
jgi:hypothetical protein